MRKYCCVLAVAAGLPVSIATAKAADAPSLPSESTERGPDRTEILENRIQELTEQIRRNEEERRQQAPRLTINGYTDIGFFAPMGNNGVGWIRDFGNSQFPEHANYSWTFLGDILATTINTRGEVADLGDAPGITRFDSVDSNGAPGVLVNELNLRLSYALTDQAIMRTSVNLIPRSGRDFALGDFAEVDLAELEYVLTDDGNTSVFVGKVLPVFGIEYRDRKSDQRFGITPSLLHRYTSGPQLGVKVRTKVLREWIVLAASATNNSSGTEQFHFQSEIDQNSGKTLNGRVALSVPVGDFIQALGRHRLEVGFSGEWGPQDWATDNDGKIWFAGVDLFYQGINFAIKAQAMRGEAPGRADQNVWSLKLNKAAYLEVNWQVLARFGIVLRAEARDAVVTLGTERLYLTQEARFTGGVRVVFNPHMVIKVEYLHNREWGRIEQFNNDVVTSSLVLAF